MTHPPPTPERLAGIGGLLLFLCINLTILGPLYGLADVIGLSGLLSDDLPLSVWVLAMAEIAASILFTVWSVVAGIRMWQRKPDGPSNTRWFLWSLFAWRAVATGWAAAIGLFALKYQATTLIGTLTYAWFCSMYLSESQRVANTYGLAPESEAASFEML